MLNATVRTPVRPYLGCTIYIAIAVATLSACSSETDSALGGGAGDELGNSVLTEDIALLSQVSGVYDLTGNWSGTEGDAAFLVVREPAENATAAVLLYDIDDDIGNCSNQPIQGEATVNRFTDTPQIFLDGIFDFDSAIIARNGTSQLLMTFTDVNDIDNDADTGDRINYTATVVAQMESDLPGLC